MVDRIFAFSKMHFGAQDLMTRQEAEDLSWSYTSALPTPERQILVRDLATNPDFKHPSFVEVPRCLSRFYCYDLLKKGAHTYSDFVANQANNPSHNAPLTQAQYADLCQEFKNIDQLIDDCHRVATIVSSIPLNEKVKRIADGVLGKNNWSNDSTLFLADVFKDVNKAQQIYPVVKMLFDKYLHPDAQARIRTNLQIVFSSERHYRHQLYTEGDESMFKNFIDDIKSKRFTHENFLFWRRHWKINITGFLGMLNPKGALYLTSNTYKGMKALDNVHEQMQKGEHSDKALLRNYLIARAKLLGIDHLPLREEEILFLAHLGAMLRLFSPEEGAMLVMGYQKIPADIRHKSIENYFHNPDQNRLAPRFAPALFVNWKMQREKDYQTANILDPEYYPPELQGFVEEFRKIEQSPPSAEKTAQEKYLKHLLSIVDTVIGAMPLYQRTLVLYNLQRVEGKIKDGIPLSFQKAAGADYISALCGGKPIGADFKIMDHRKPWVNVETGEAVLMHPERADILWRFQGLAKSLPSKFNHLQLDLRGALTADFLLPPRSRSKL